MTADQWIALVAGIVRGALRVGAPFLFVSLGECLTEKSGRINLGLEGVLVLSAMAAFGGAYLTDSAWLGVLVGAVAGAALALLHGLLCSLDRVNDVATGIALMLLGTGLAFYLGKPLIQPQAPQIPAIPLGFWSDNTVVRSALQLNALVPIGVAGTPQSVGAANADRSGAVLVRPRGLAVAGDRHRQHRRVAEGTGYVDDHGRVGPGRVR